jgi:cytidylate kinase
MEKKIIIAIDGHASCGKSTFAKMIAKELGYIYIDSGAMYRAVTLHSLRKGLTGINGTDREGIIRELAGISIRFSYNTDTGSYETYLNNENVESEIRNIEVSGYVSEVSRIREVRNRMVELQREIGIYKGIVMDGRDIGTVVFPDAEIKIFLTASVEVRAMRRFLELKEKGVDANPEEIRSNIEERDKMDSSREISPLIMAEDALLLDNSNMTPERQMSWFRELLKRVIS